MKKSVRSSFCACFIACLCFMFSGCISSTGDGSALVDSLNDLQVVSLGHGEQTGVKARAMVKTLAEQTFNALKEEYGSSLVANKIERSEQDTHEKAMQQDTWVWFDVLSTTYNNDVWFNLLPTTAEQDAISLLELEFLNVLNGENVLGITPYSTEFVSLKASGGIDNNALQEKANRLNHVGFFYYELDNIAEYILNYVIGSEVVLRDNYKFVDANLNGTFDYVENYVSTLSGNTTNNIIKGYNFNFERSEKTYRNGVWSRIEWGKNSDVPTIVDDVDTQDKQDTDIIKANLIVQEKAVELADIESVVRSKLQESGQFASGEIENELISFKQGGVSTNEYSGFKNYVNTVYYILYEQMNNFTFTYMENGVSTTDIIPNVLEMAHLPNIETLVISAEDSCFDEQNYLQRVPCREYKSVLVTAKQFVAINNFNFVMYTDMPNVTLQVKITMRYHFANDDYRQYIGTYAGEERTVEGEIATVSFDSSEPTGYSVNLTFTEQTVKDLQDRGVSVTEEDITGVARQGVNNVVMDKYKPFEYEAGALPSWWALQEGYLAYQSGALQGSSFKFVNENINADYLELLFDVVGSYDDRVTFGFGFMWL